MCYVNKKNLNSTYFPVMFLKNDGNMKHVFVFISYVCHAYNDSLELFPVTQLKELYFGYKECLGGKHQV